MEPNQSGNTSKVNFGLDVSQQNVYFASQGLQIAGEDITHRFGEIKNRIAEIKNRIEIDNEVANLLSWLAEQQGTSRELALKKAIATAAYIHDITTSQGGKLLVQRKDHSVGEIVLK